MEGKALVVRSQVPFRAISSAVLNGGLAHASSIINLQVASTYICREPEVLLRRAIETEWNVKPPVIGLMTAANIRNYALNIKKVRNLTVAAITTAGLSYPATAGDDIVHRDLRAGTINLIIIIDGNPTNPCLVNAVMTATEAKAAALRELGIRSKFSGEICTGTTSDAIVIAATGRGRPILYAGTATTLGYLIARSIREGVKKTVAKQRGSKGRL
jgi:iron complex transport system ATP-binding protein